MATRLCNRRQEAGKVDYRLEVLYYGLLIALQGRLRAVTARPTLL